MKTNRRLGGLIALLLPMAAVAGIPEVITYRGVLGLPPDTESPLYLDMAFSLYDSAVSNAPAAWSRTINNVPVATNGAFAVELSDDGGGGTKLVDALARMKGAPEVGLRLRKLGNDFADELKPRQRLQNTVRAARASRAQAADRFVAERGVTMETVQTEMLSAKNLTVGGALTVDGACGLLSSEEEREIGGVGSTVRVKGVRALHPPHFVRAALSENYATTSAPCDLLLTYEDEGRVFNVIVPRGGRIAAAQGTTNSVVAATEFGN